MKEILKKPGQKPTPAEYLVQKACHWRNVERALIADKNPRTALAHHEAKLDLRSAVDQFVTRSES